jgi:hypothetical protein
MPHIFVPRGFEAARSQWGFLKQDHPTCSTHTLDGIAGCWVVEDNGTDMIHGCSVCSCWAGLHYCALEVSPDSSPVGTFRPTAPHLLTPHPLIELQSAGRWRPIVLT